jgi:hypothetical protein
MIAAPPQGERCPGRVGDRAGSDSADANPSTVTGHTTVEELTFSWKINPSLAANSATVEGFAFTLPYLLNRGPR